MSSGKKKHASSGARTKQRKKRGKKAGGQFLLPVDDGRTRTGAAVADIQAKPAGVLPSICLRAGCPLRFADAPAKSEGVLPDGTPPAPASGGSFLSSGGAFLQAVCVCLLLLVFASERAAHYLDEFAPNAVTDTLASLLRTIGETSGAARLGAWEDALIRLLAGTAPSGRRQTPLSAEAGAQRGQPRSVETARAPAREPASVPAEPASGARTVPELSAPDSTRAASGQQDVPDAPTLAAERPELPEPQDATTPQAATVTEPQEAPAATPQAADTVPPSPAEARRESAGADAAVSAGLSGTAFASLPENLGRGETDKARKTVLLVGDSMMGWGLGHMLERGIRAYPRISVKRYSRPSTGLCRSVDVDWPKYLEELVAAHSPDLVVISIGANDGSTMTDQDRRACTVFTPAWEKEYRRRAGEFVRIAGSRGAKVLWVGLPVAGVDKIEKVLRTVSRLQQEACAKYDFASYLDVRAVLTDKNGRYTAFSAGDNAKPVRIRAADKVHVSEAGGKLLTDYLMPAVLKALGDVPQESAGRARGTARAKAVARAGKAGG
ncbi:MAG: DUF459 domain-containing protein [Desulfovibrio sp.]|jgi:hypothetical protein|nr:DUF459 domain-containing protein [Desulfovibrio sp.]